MQNIILDLETIPHPDAHLWAQPMQAPANYKDPEKIAAYIADATKERDERFGLHPDFNRIVALGTYDVTGEPNVDLLTTEEEERNRLILLWSQYRPGQTRFVTFNGARFDLPVLLMRSLYLAVPHPEVVIAPAWKSSHIDLWDKLSLGGARKDVGSLKFYATRFGIPVFDDIGGADVARMFAAGRLQEIHDHCLSDLTLTRALAERIGAIPRVAVTA